MLGLLDILQIKVEYLHLILGWGGGNIPGLPPPLYETLTVISHPSLFLSRSDDDRPKLVKENMMCWWARDAFVYCLMKCFLIVYFCFLNRKACAGLHSCT